MTTAKELGRLGTFTKLREKLEKDGYKNHHTSYCRGYVSRKNDSFIILPYKGIFGEGFAVRTTNFDSTIYCYVTYFVK